MFVTALGIAIKTTLKNHIFGFDDEIRKQVNGGARGVTAARDIACLFMVWWDRTFIRYKVATENIDMKNYSRYVDD